MQKEWIQTLHPHEGKVNKKIALDKYHYIKTQLLAILANKSYTHTELMEELYARVKNDFEGGVQWYGEVVKLDLEARNLIFRTQGKPVKYTLTVPIMG